MTLLTFPKLAGLGWPITRTNLGFNVVKQESLSGARTRFAQRSVPAYRWTVSFSILRAYLVGSGSDTVLWSDDVYWSDGAPWLSPGAAIAELQTLAGFYNQMNGTVLPFLYTEPNDSLVTLQNFGAGDGAAVAFQLVRTWGGFTEPVYSVGPAPIQVYVAGTLQAASAYSVGTTGVVTFASAPASAAALTWTGQYQWICRFDDDNVEFEQFMRGMWSLSKMTFSSELF